MDLQDYVALSATVVGFLVILMIPGPGPCRRRLATIIDRALLWGVALILAIGIAGYQPTYMG